MIEVTIPLRLVSGNRDITDHWRKRQARAKEQRGIVAMRLRPWANGRPGGQSGKWLVTLTRVAPRKLDSDNLSGACKHVRDGVADALGVDDGDARLEWRYEQRKSDGKATPSVPVYAVHIRIEAKERTTNE